MAAFLFFGALGFGIYECLAWANIPKSRFGFNIGQGVEVSGSAAIWVRRGLRALVALVAVLIIIALGWYYLARGALPGSQFAILLGAFWGPLLGIWFNAVIANRPGANLTRGQLIAGLGLGLAFLVGSVGDETGRLIRQYAKQIKNLKIAGAEFSFSDRARSSSPGLGNIGPNVSTSHVSGSVGLPYLSELDKMIDRDLHYIDALQQRKLRDINEELQQLAVFGELGKITYVARRQELEESRRQNDDGWKKTSDALAWARGFAAQAVAKPMKCLLNWYEQTGGDVTRINRHLTSYGAQFSRLRASNSPEQFNDIANGIVHDWIAIGLEFVASVPTNSQSGCDDLFEEVCPGISRDKDVLVRCLKLSREAVGGKSSNPEDASFRLRDNIEKFVANNGVIVRPYFVIAYAGILAQLGQYEASRNALREWLLNKARDKKKLRGSGSWSLAEEWFEIRARSMLVTYMEEWISKQGANPPTKILNSYIYNLTSVIQYLEDNVMARPFFQEIQNQMRRIYPIDAKPNSASCPRRSDAEFRQAWRPLFETYVTFRLSRARARLLHADYQERFAESTTEEVRELTNMNLSCIPETKDAQLYYAQIREAFARNALMYTEQRSKWDSEEQNRKRLDEAISFAEHGERLLLEVKRMKAEDASDDSSLGIDNEIDDTHEKLKAALRLLKRAKDDL